MKSSSKKEKKQKKKVSMKEAFEKVKVIKSKEKRSNKEDSIREKWWNYPSFFGKIAKASRPLSYILIFSFIGALICLYISKPEFLNSLKKESKTTFIEGSVGAVSSFNPIYLTQNVIDKSIDELVFEKFIEIDKDGNPQPGIAVNWSSSKDNLTYTFSIEHGHYWQDGQLLTADDVVFTFNTAITLADTYGEDSVGVSLSGVAVSKIDENTVQFVLKSVNATFFEAVSIYILPEHRLKDVDLDEMKFDVFSQYPLGSGPYKVVLTEPNVVELEASSYYQKSVGIKNFTYRIYDDLDSLQVAFRNGELDAVSGVDSGGMDFFDEYSGYRILETNLYQRTKMVFFNLRRDSLKKAGMRQALSYLTNKTSLLDISGIPGAVALGTIPESSWAFNSSASQYVYNPEEAASLLNDLGYTKNQENGYFESEDGKILSFTISYLKNDSNDKLVNALKSLWEKEGVILNLDPLSYDEITQEVISTRNFEMLLYEVETTVDPDQYNLWHSLKVDYPDLNLSGYDYERVDILLEDGRLTVNQSKRKEYYNLFQKYLMQDAPALFLYHPSYIYVIPEGLEGPDLNSISFPEERFRNISDWVWN